MLHSQVKQILSRYEACDKQSVTAGVDSGWVLCNPSWGKTIVCTERPNWQFGQVARSLMRKHAEGFCAKTAAKIIALFTHWRNMRLFM